MPTLHTRRVCIIVSLASKDLANARMKAKFDPTGGDKTFFRQFAFGGSAVATHYVCCIALTEQQYARIPADLPPGVTVLDCSLVDAANQPLAVLQRNGYEPIGTGT